MLMKRLDETGESESLPSYDEVDSELPKWSRYDRAKVKPDSTERYWITKQMSERCWLHRRRRRALIVQMQDNTWYRIKWKVWAHFKDPRDCGMGDSKRFIQLLADAHSGRSCDYHPDADCYCVRWEVDGYKYYWDLVVNLHALMEMAGVSQCPEYTEVDI